MHVKDAETFLRNTNNHDYRLYLLTCLSIVELASLNSVVGRLVHGWNTVIMA